MTTTASPTLGRPVGANGEETRQRILSATMRCVAEVGYPRASIRDIARAAGMTSASLYHYFPTNAKLLAATVATIEDIALPRLRAAGLRGNNAVERLESVLDESNTLMREYPYLAAFERATRVESAAFVRSKHPDRIEFAVLHSIIAGIIDDARRDGELAPEADAAGAVNAIYALTRGLTEQAASLPPTAYRNALRSAKQLIRGTIFTA